MRQRKANLFSGSPSRSETNQFEDNDDGSSISDPEDGIQAIPPEDENDSTLSLRIRENESSRIGEGKNHKSFRQFGREFLRGALDGKIWWAQWLSITTSALLTYSYIVMGARVNVQIAIMTIITLVGASPLCNSHLTTAAIGTFVGGQNIIGAIGTDSAGGAEKFLFSNYLWLVVLAVTVGFIWCFFITNPRINLLNGYSGRLGTTTFLGMNAIMICLWGPLGVVDWNRYYYGFVHLVPVAEEDSSSSTLASVWSWSEKAELAIGYILSVIWIGMLSGITRIRNDQFIAQWHNEQKAKTSMEEIPPFLKPEEPTRLNNVLIPVLLTLLSILLVNATGYQHSSGLFNGFAVGAYVGMASLQKIPNVARFATVSAVAALWGLAMTPFFVGFAGKSGFTSMLGHVTHDVIVRVFGVLRRRKRLRQQEEEEQLEQQRVRDEEQRKREEEEKVHEQKMQEQHIQEKVVQEPYHPPHKPSRKKEQVFLTKQQRRQQQRLMQQQRQEPTQITTQTHSNTTEMAPLRHRAWVATPTDGVQWEHPQLQRRNSLNAMDQVSKSNIV